MRIDDFKWKKHLLSTFCRRAVHGAADRAAIERLRLEVEYSATWSLLVHLCDARGPLVTLDYDGQDATVLAASSLNKALYHARPEALTASVRTFLRRHDLIDEFDRVKVA